MPERTASTWICTSPLGEAGDWPPLGVVWASSSWEAELDIVPAACCFPGEEISSLIMSRLERREAIKAERSVLAASTAAPSPCGASAVVVEAAGVVVTSSAVVVAAAAGDAGASSEGAASATNSGARERSTGCCSWEGGVWPSARAIILSDGGVDGWPPWLEDSRGPVALRNSFSSSSRGSRAKVVAVVAAPEAWEGRPRSSSVSSRRELRKSSKSVRTDRRSRSKRVQTSNGRFLNNEGRSMDLPTLFL